MGISGQTLVGPYAWFELKLKPADKTCFPKLPLPQNPKPMRLCLLCLLLPFFSIAQNGYKIEGQIKGLRDTTCQLGHFYGDATTYIPKDTVRVDANGRLVFEADKPLPQGIYLVVLPGGAKYIQFIMGAQQKFSFVTDTAKIVENLVVTGSIDNIAFYERQKALNQIVADAEAARKQAPNADDANLKKKLADAQKKAEDYDAAFERKYAGTLVAQLVKAPVDPVIPPAPKLPNGKTDSLWQFNYYKNHFWDNFNLADERLIRTPFLHPKIDRYLKELTVQSPDSLIKEVDFIAQKAAPNADMRQHLIWYMTNQTEQSAVLGLEPVFVHLVEKYYLSGQMSIRDSANLDKLRSRVETLKPLLVGKRIPSLNMTDTLGRTPSLLYDTTTDYTVLFIYDPDCGHCRDAAPVLKKFQEAHRSEVSVFAAAVAGDAAKWKAYVKEFGLGEWLNGFDYSGQHQRIRERFDAQTTPAVYLIDKDKKIVARRLPVEELERFLAFYKKQPKAGR